MARLFLFLLIWGVWLVPYEVVFAQDEATAISVRRGEHPTFSRVVFDFLQVPQYQITKAGDRIRLQFAQKHAFDFSVLRNDPLAHIMAIEAQADDDQNGSGTSLVITINPQSSFRHFLSGASLVLDVFPAQNAEGIRAEAAAEPAPPPQNPPQDMRSAAAEQGAAALSPLSYRPEASADLLPLSLVKDADGIELAFGWQKGTTAAVFLRSGWLWTIFEDSRRVDLSAVERSVAEGNSGPLRSAEQMDAQGFTALRFDLVGAVGLSVRRTGQIWRVRIVSGASAPARELTPVRQAGAQGTVIFVAADEVGGRLSLVDPAVGDRLSVIPLGDDGRGLAQDHQYVDFHLLPSAQGLVIDPVADGLQIVRFATGVSIGSQRGLAISGSDLAARMGAGRGGIVVSRMIDLDAWRQGAHEGTKADYTAREQQMLVDLSLADAASRKSVRWDLARYYAGHGAYPEAYAMLALLADTDPEIKNTLQWKAVSGVVLLGLNRPLEALSALLDPNLDAESDLWLWRALAANRAERHALALDYFRRGSEALALHDRPFLAKIHLAIAQSAMAEKAYDLASGQITSLQNMGLSGNQALAVDYLYGQLVQSRGDIATARARYQDAASARDRHLATKARLQLARLEYGEGNISISEATARLERLRFAWRGDRLEMDVLETLADLYRQQEQYRQALLTLQLAASAFATDAQSRDLAAQMSAIFSRLFLDGAADKLPPLEALGLFYDFSELTPLGSSGDRMIRHLVERLVSVDLVDRAAELLEHQVSYRLEGSAQALVAAQLGKIYLLDGRPEDTLRIMRATRQPILPDDVLKQRTLVSARALSELKRYEEALVLLENTSGREADQLRADIYWASQDWSALATISDRLLGNRWRNEAPLALPEREVLIRQALALSFNDARERLAQLRSRYRPLIMEGDYAGVFDLLTSPSGTPAGELGRIAGELGGVDQFRSFLSAYRAEFTPTGGTAF